MTETACGYFSGLQRQPNVKTVAGVVEKALSCLDPVHPVHLVASSRTDKGVHALCNTAHVDLENRDVDSLYDENVITHCINRYMKKHKESIRILKTLRVNDQFNSRFQAIHRTYLYRVCVTKDDHFLTPFPLQEDSSCFFVRKEVDWQKVKEAANMLNGTHDFSQFTAPRALKEQPWVNPVKSLELSIAPGRSKLQEHLPDLNCSLEFWDFTFTSGSFLYHQVRHMTALLLATGMGKVTLELIQHLLDSPSDSSDKVTRARHFDVPGYGLYLKNVGYHENELKVDCVPPAQRKMGCGEGIPGL